MGRTKITISGRNGGNYFIITFPSRAAEETTNELAKSLQQKGVSSITVESQGEKGFFWQCRMARGVELDTARIAAVAWSKGFAPELKK